MVEIWYGIIYFARIEIKVFEVVEILRFEVVGLIEIWCGIIHLLRIGLGCRVQSLNKIG